MDISKWKARYLNRNDISIRITHLTKGETMDHAYDNLIKILNDKRLIGGSGYIVGENKAVCFQELPLLAIAENVMFEESQIQKEGTTKHRYSMFGLRFAKTFVYQAGGRPVIYGKTSELKDMLPSSEYWRIVDMELDDNQRLVDWSHEREWRIKGDLEFDYSDIEVIVPEYTYYHRFIDYCMEKNSDILRKIKGIIPLVAVFG